MTLLRILFLESVLFCCCVSSFHGDLLKIIHGSLDGKFPLNNTCYKKLQRMSIKQLLPYLDASGKPGAGIGMGNLVWLGNYDECVGIKDAHYCSMKNLKVMYQNNSMSLQLGLCLPGVCDVMDAITLLETLSQAVNISKFHVQIKVESFSEGTYGPNVVCYNSDITYSAGTVTMLVISGLIGLLCLVGTSIDIVQRMMTNEDEEDKMAIIHEEENDTGMVNPYKVPETSFNRKQHPQISMHAVQVNSSNNKFVEFFLCFSLVKNSKTLFDTTVPEGAITCLNGIRTISIMWVVMGHFVIFTLQSGSANPKTALSWVTRFTMQPLLNGGLAVDTFFLLSGVLVSYLSMKRFDKHGRLPLLRYYVHRYIRLTPSYAYVIFFSTYIFPVLYDGPGWTTGDQEQHCKDYWWTNILYINNFYPESVLNICVAVSWYLANDMQFYVISPIILWCMYKFGWKGIGLLAVVISTLHFLTNGILMHEKDASPLFYEPGAHSFGGPHSQVLSYQNYIYTKPYCRIMVYFMGLVLGYVLYKKCYFDRRRSTVYYYLGWSLFVPLIFSVIYGPFTSTKHVWGEAENQTYGLLFRMTWALCVGWVIFACHNNHGGLVNDFLSWKAFIPLSRLTYGTYLIHIFIIFLISNSQRQPFYLSELNFSIHYTSVTVFSFCTAYIMSVCLEYPVFNLEKLFIQF